MKILAFIHQGNVSVASAAVSSNQSLGDYPECRGEREAAREVSLLVSPLVVAGIVIGLVLFLSCITIIIGSLRKDSHLHLRASYGQDGFSHGGSVGELRSSCLEEFPSGLDLYGETLEQSGLYPDSPPRYDECMGTSFSDMHLPTEAPPPYSLLDPFGGEAGPGEEPHPPFSHHSSFTDLPPTTSSSWFSSAPHYCSSISYSSISYSPTEEAPPYEAALLDSGRPLPLTPCELFKHQSEAREEAEAGLTR